MADTLPRADDGYITVRIEYDYMDVGGRATQDDPMDGGGRISSGMKSSSCRARSAYRNMNEVRGQSKKIINN